VSYVILIRDFVSTIRKLFHVKYPVATSLTMRLIVPWKVTPRERDQITQIKFQSNDGESFKIYEYTLDSFDLGDILQHVVSFEQKICQAVTDREQRQRCFGKVFGRTLARPLQATWETFTTQFGVPVNDAGFFNLVKAMIASFATEDDKRDLLNANRISRRISDDFCESRRISDESMLNLAFHASVGFSTV